MILALSFLGILVLGIASIALRTIGLIMEHDDEMANYPDPDICPGCDGYLDFDDDGSNICTGCGLTWWRR